MTSAPALDELSNDLAVAAKAARKGADYTATLASARAGRASYLSADQLGATPNPGAEAVALLLEASANRIDG